MGWFGIFDKKTGSVMEPLTEVIPENRPSSYELERNKPIPTLIHGAIQFNIGFEIKSDYLASFVLPAR